MWFIAYSRSIRTFVAAVSLLGFGASSLAAEAANKAAEERLYQAVKFLASDELEGRGLETKGIQTAADYIAREFRKAGLKTDLYDGQTFQTFDLKIGAKLGPKEKNTLVFSGAIHVLNVKKSEIVLELGKDFQTLAAGGSAKFTDLPLVFVGYGITAKQLDYDDYADIDVKGKVVVMLRHEPQQENPHSKFDGTRPSRHAEFRTKIANAVEHGAAAIIFCTSEHEIRRGVAHVQKRLDTTLADLEKARAAMADDKDATLLELEQHRKKIAELAADVLKWTDAWKKPPDPLLSIQQAGIGDGGRAVPVIHCRRAIVDRMLIGSYGKSLADMEREIDKDLKPQSRTIGNWHATGETNIVRNNVSAENVIGVLEAAGPLAEETIVIGAHYDHLGYGGPGSLAGGHGKQAAKEIHNGADDNASGTAALLELARRLAAKRDQLKRRIVFIAFTGEESGLLGSAHYVKNPLVPLDKTVAMLNFDMVGRMNGDKLVIFGTGSASEFDEMIERLAKRRGLELAKSTSGYGPSDQTSFYAKKIPVMHFFTGTHSDYHRPSDDFEKVNARGMRRVVELVDDIAVELARADKAPTYREVASPASIAKAGDRPYFGSIPDFAGDGSGYQISGVSSGGPAAKAGLKGGDRIVKFGESKITNLEDFDNALRKHKAGDKVKLTVLRAAKQVELEVTLDPPR